MSTIDFTRDMLGKFMLPLAFVAAATHSQGVAADIYMYTDSDGTRWLTNASVQGKKSARLIARTPKAKVQPVAMTNSTTAKRSAKRADTKQWAGVQAELPPLKVVGKVGSCTRLSHAQIERRTAPHLDTIRKYARHYGVEENLIRAVMRQESCFNAGARSHVGATGLMQLMPGTADMMGVANIHDPRQNIRGGAKYLADMLRKFDGNKQLALAAYNAGPGAVYKHGGIPPYRETQDYVHKVLYEYKRLEHHQYQEQYANAQQQDRQPVANYARSGYQVASFNRHQGANFAVSQYN